MKTPETTKTPDFAIIYRSQLAEDGTVPGVQCPCCGEAAWPDFEPFCSIRCEAAGPHQAD